MSTSVEFKHILVPTDFGEAARAALEAALSLSNKYGATIHLVHAYEPPPYPYPGMGNIAVDLLTPVREAAEKELASALAELRERAPTAQGTVAFGSAWREILRAAEDTHADLIVMGTHGRRGVTHMLLGSVAEKVVRAAPIPVMTVRAGSSPA